MNNLSINFYTYILTNDHKDYKYYLERLNKQELKWVLILLEDLARRDTIKIYFNIDFEDIESTILNYKSKSKIFELTNIGRQYVQNLVSEKKDEISGIVCFVIGDSAIDIERSIENYFLHYIISPIIILDINKFPSLLKDGYINQKIDVICWVLNERLVETYQNNGFKKDLRLSNILQFGFYLERCEWKNHLSTIKVMPEKPFSDISNDIKQGILTSLRNLINSSKSQKPYVSTHDMAKEIILDNYLSKGPILDLGNCGLTDENFSLLDDLTICKEHLEELILSNEWSEYINGKWERRFSRNFGRKNILYTIPPQIEKLLTLKVFRCGGDWGTINDKKRWKISNINSVLKLKNLEYLNLSNNEIEDINGIEYLKNLEFLHLNNNFIKTIPNLKGLVKLVDLYLSNNLIKNITGLKALPSLKTIDLHSNQIENLKPIKSLIAKLGLTNSVWEANTINIAKNKYLNVPPLDIIDNGKEAVLRYFEKISFGRPYINNEVKVVLVGNSGVGKSTMVKHFLGRHDIDNPHSFTHWLKVYEFKSKGEIKKLKQHCNIRLFDFGGHDYYHDTHNIFFSQDTVFLVLWDEKTNKLKYREIESEKSDGSSEMSTQDYPLKYWLESISFYTKDEQATNLNFKFKKKEGYHCFALVMQNKVASNEETIWLDNLKLQDKYPFIFDFINIDIKKPRNIDHFDTLFHEILENATIVGRKYPEYYGIIKNFVENNQNNSWITLDDFEQVCNEICDGDLDYNDIQDVIVYLKGLGIILYTEPSESNNGIVFLNIRETTILIQKLLTKIKKGEGVLDHSEIYLTDPAVIGIISLLENYKILIKIPNTNKYIAPLYLPNTPPIGVGLLLEQIKKPYRRFQYKGFIFKNVILCLFQHLISSSIIEKESFYYWKDGLIIKDHSSSEPLLIKFNLGDDNGNAWIDLFKIGKSKSRAFSDEIIKAIIDVNVNHKIKEMVSLDGEEFLPKKLIQRKFDQEHYVFSYKKKYYNALDYKEFFDKPLNMKKVFISYSKTDIVHLKELEKHFSLLKRNGHISVWHCSELIPGAKWDGKIKKELQEADIIIFLVSSDFWATNYIWDYEIKAAICRDEDPLDSVKVVPIIVRSCDWEDSPLGQFNTAPKKAQVINLAEDIDTAWTNVVKELKKIIFPNEYGQS